MPPIGIVPKKEPGKFGAITDLSYPPEISVNNYIVKVEFYLKYITIDLAINFIQSLGQGCYLSNIDIAHAFRIIPVSPEHWHMLVSSGRISSILIPVCQWAVVPVQEYLTTFQ